MEITYRDFISAFRALGLDPKRPVIAHASLRALGDVRGGADAVVGALLSCFRTVVMPAFTCRTMVIPEEGPGDNALEYGSGRDANKMAEFYQPDMPADRMMGAVAEALRRHPQARRSSHPILSFAGVYAEQILATQTLVEPLAPIGALLERGGVVLLLGVDHSVDTSIHYAERLSGRRAFVRWALTPDGIVECPGFPGCSDGFGAIAPRLEVFTRRVEAGQSVVEAVPLIDLMRTVEKLLAEEPLALLCSRKNCPRCNAMRAAPIQRPLAGADDKTIRIAAPDDKTIRTAAQDDKTVRITAPDDKTIPITKIKPDHP